MIKWDKKDILKELFEEFREEFISKGSKERDLKWELENTLTLRGDWSEYGRCGKFRAIKKWYHLIYNRDEAKHIARQVAREVIEDILKTNPESLPLKWYDKYIYVEEETIKEMADELEEELRREYGIRIVPYYYMRGGYEDVEYEEEGDVETLEVAIDDFYYDMRNEPATTLHSDYDMSIREILKQPYVKIKWGEAVADWVEERGWLKTLDAVTDYYYLTKNGLVYFPAEKGG
jgi:hypothetical protein